MAEETEVDLFAEAQAQEKNEIIRCALDEIRKTHPEYAAFLRGFITGLQHKLEQYEDGE